MISLLKNSTAPESKILIPVDNNLKVPCSKLTCQLIYSVLVKPTKQNPHQLVTGNKNSSNNLMMRAGSKCFDAKEVTIQSYTRCFQFKIINNALFHNSQLYKFGLVDSPKCSFCGMIDETSIHFFSECNITLDLWRKVKN